jgi:hypothetical protein
LNTCIHPLLEHLRTSLYFGGICVCFLLIVFIVICLNLLFSPIVVFAYWGKSWNEREILLKINCKQFWKFWNNLFSKLNEVADAFLFKGYTCTFSSL